MTRRLVLDASAAITMVRSEPDGAAVRRTLQAWKRAGGTVSVPDQFWLEIVNSLTQRHRWEGRDVLRALHELDTFELEAMPFHRPLLLEALDLVERFGLTAYDALYLAAAMADGASLLTLDRQLASAAGDRAVTPGDQPRLHEAAARYEHEVTWPRYREASALLAKLRAEALRGDDRAVRRSASRAGLALGGAGAAPVDAQLDDVGDVPLE